MDELVSIIVPTRNRGDTLCYALETLLRIPDQNIEIIVSDNASDDDTASIVAAFSDARLRYLNTGRRFGMSQNWEFALAHSRGDWIGFLGDDDGILPDAIERLRGIVARTGVSAVRSATCSYIWPSLQGSGRGELVVPMRDGVRILDASTELMRVLRGRAPYTSLPILYNGGFARRSIVERARDSSGRFFRSRIPDVYSGIAVAHLVEKFAFSDRPLVINGASIHSTGTSQFSRSLDPKHVRASQAFLEEENLPFHEAVPLNRDGSIPRSLHALVLESWYQAATLFPELPSIGARDQLSDTLRAAVSTEPIADWSKDFADQHGLDIRAATRATWLTRQWRRFERGAAVLRDPYWHSDLLPGAALGNVAEATSIAAKILTGSRSPMKIRSSNLLRLARKRWLSAPAR